MCRFIAEVKKVEGNRIFVHYAGYDEMYDEWIYGTNTLAKVGSCTRTKLMKLFYEFTTNCTTNSTTEEVYNWFLTRQPSYTVDEDYDMIDKPMYFRKIEKNFRDTVKYDNNAQEFFDDVKQIFTHAKHNNTEISPYYKAADKLEKLFNSLVPDYFKQFMDEIIQNGNETSIDRASRNNIRMRCDELD